jgi:uncharacterized protein YlxP (DUF503 family)
VHAAVIAFEFHIPQSRSLKAKRAAIKPIVEGIRSRFKLSVAEVDFLDQWQRARIGVAAVSGSARHLEDVLDTVERFVAVADDVELLDTDITYLEAE